MPKYRITGPDGGTYEITAPEGANEQQVLAFAQQQFGGGKPAAAPADPERQKLLASTPMRLAKGGKDPIDGAAQLLQRVLPESVVSAVNKAADAVGGEGTFLGDVLGVKGMSRQQLDADIRGSNAEYEAARAAQGQQGFDGARLAGNVLSPANAAVNRLVPLPRVGATVKELATKGAVAGAAGAAVQPVMTETGDDYWSSKARQVATGATVGSVATPALVKGAEGATKAVKSVAAAVRGTPSAEAVRVATANILASQGMKPGEAPEVILQGVQRQVEEAMRAGSKLDPAAIVRRAQFEAVGLTEDAAPTLGQLTRDPMQFANEKNLSGVRLRTPQGEGNPLAARFQAQNNRLQEVFDHAGAAGATDRVTAGQSIMDALKKADAPVKAGVDEAYTAARAMTGGRAAELDRGAFSQAANKALDDGMWGRFVPDNIRGLLNDVTAGKTPFTVDAAEQIDGILSAAQRRAGQGTPEASAIGVIRNALRDTPFTAAAPVQAGESAAAAAARTVDDLNAPIVDVPFRPAGGPQKALPPPSGGAVSFQIPQPGAAAAVDEGAAAREAFAQARAAARQRFATIESTPALKAALDGDAPDKFVQRYVLGADVADLQAMKKVLDSSPEALGQARAQIAAYLKGAAFGPNVTGDGAFAADRYARTLAAIGPEKLKVFFSPAELVRLNLAGKVAGDINSIPAGARYATNTSGTGAAVMNLLSKLAESPVLRNIPGARMVANQIGEIRTEQEINRALSAPAAKQATELSPEAMRTLQLLFPQIGVASGAVAGSTAR